MTSPAWLAYSLFTDGLFYFGTDLSRYLSERRICFTDTCVMTQDCQRTSRISIIFFNYFTRCKKPQKMHCIAFLTCFSLGDFTFSITAQNGLGYSKTENEWIIYDDLTFIQYIIDYCGATSSPDHRVRNLIKFRKSYLLISQGAKNRKKCIFSRVFYWVTSRFDRCAKTVCARRNPKTNVSSTMNYLSSDTTKITVV